MTLNDIIEIVKKAGNIIRHAHAEIQDIHEKTCSSDLVTKYDYEVQSFLKQSLLQLLPEASFLGEEGEKETLHSDWVFIVDPIDGTTNFIREMNYSNISVALAYRGKVQYAVVYNPFVDECFAAERHKGATLNGKEIHVSDRDLKHAIVLCGSTIYDRSYTEESFSLMRKFYDVTADFRRFGAAALDLCHIAAGRAEIFFECRLSPWDFAAGSLIVEESGGTCTSLTGEEYSPLSPSSVYATNRLCKDAIRQINLKQK